MSLLSESVTLADEISTVLILRNQHLDELKEEGRSKLSSFEAPSVFKQKEDLNCFTFSHCGHRISTIKTIINLLNLGCRVCSAHHSVFSRDKFQTQKPLHQLKSNVPL